MMDEEHSTYNELELQSDLEQFKAETEHKRIELHRAKVDQLTTISMAVLFAVAITLCVTIVQMTDLQGTCIEKGWVWHGLYCEAPKPLEDFGVACVAIGRDGNTVKIVCGGEAAKR